MSLKVHIRQEAPHTTTPSSSHFLFREPFSECRESSRPCRLLFVIGGLLFSQPLLETSERGLCPLRLLSYLRRVPGRHFLFDLEMLGQDRVGVIQHVGACSRYL